MLQGRVRIKKLREFECVGDVAFQQVVDHLGGLGKGRKFHVLGTNVLSQAGEKLSISKVGRREFQGSNGVMGLFQDLGPISFAGWSPPLPGLRRVVFRWTQGVQVVVSKHEIGSGWWVPSSRVFRHLTPSMLVFG